jgi:hypothetical protein
LVKLRGNVNVVRGAVADADSLALGLAGQLLHRIVAKLRRG